jgi:hypothetical protein
VAAKKTGVYQILVYIAYAYFILFSGFWLYTSFDQNHRINYVALAILIAFVAQCYFKNRIANLVIGIIGLAISIFMFLETCSTFDLFKKGAQFDLLVKSLLWACGISIVLSGILIFSYMMLNKDND